MLRLPVQPMVARPAPELPMGSGWSYEPKADGFRVIAAVAGGRARLLSRQQRSLTRFFPEVAQALAAQFTDVVLDGELVVVSGGGRLDFTALQRRLTTPGAAADAPASYNRSTHGFAGRLRRVRYRSGQVRLRPALSAL
ncbi:hypothetical protein [Pseudonocardia kunmingensis]|uniref:ATP dependent DNA ligase-like protein n=1 Tax=Pseudonocardia kunmingensis TaxID=630975 RepID=A0A543CX15_9PSEU|nr:hypothetical protein [Pseudonocardia kunmingensis]TQM01656.1 ATP dependent DNA ligase-like protein [Pseudonocardia kunmingensis]